MLWVPGMMSWMEQEVDPRSMRSVQFHIPKRHELYGKWLQLRERKLGDQNPKLAVSLVGWLFILRQIIFSVLSAYERRFKVESLMEI